jgi:diguanylate cyclase (GGDEF)-like protein/PAS domain S-box-containing protein
MSEQPSAAASKRDPGSGSDRLLSLGDLRLDRRLRWILAIYIVVIATIVGYNADAIAKERGAALIVNVAARQRALGERYVKDVYMVTQGVEADPGDDSSQLVTNAASLLNGGDVIAVQGADATVHIPRASDDPRVIAKLDEERRLINELIPAGNALMAMKNTDPGFSEQLQQLRVIGAQVTSISNDAVGQMTRDTEAAFGRLVAIGIILGVLGAIAAVTLSLIMRRMGARRLAQFRSLVNNASDMITVVDEDSNIRYQSPAAARLVGLDPAQMIGTSYLDVVDTGDADKVRALLREVADAPSNVATGEYKVNLTDGSTRYVESIVSSLITDPTVKGLVMNTRDVTDRKMLEEELSHKALHDPLTGLPNRALLRDRIEQALKRRARHGGHVAVLLLDLDGFKMINDSLGHDAGDELLVSVGNRLNESSRDEDSVARLGGDEFVIILEDDSGDPDGVSAVAARLLNDISVPYRIRGHEVFIRGSVGIAVSTGVGTTTEDLIRNADTAMYAAKGAGGGRFELFQPVMHARAMEKFEIGVELQQALVRNEFVVHYQPIVDFATQSIGGCEALVRWDHPTRGLLPPAEFISVAEDTGVIVPLGRWVLAEACGQTAAWRTRFPETSDLWVSVNLSTRQLLEPDLVHQVEVVLGETGLEPSALILEITEGSLMQDVGLTLVKLQGLKALGVRLGIDDFGTGSSSLGYLRQFPIDVLKIDKSFVDDVTTESAQASALVKAIVDLADTLNLETVAEGIELTEQLTRLRAVGCRTGQGFLFARPLGSEAMEECLGQGPMRMGDAFLADGSAAAVH